MDEWSYLSLDSAKLLSPERFRETAVAAVSSKTDGLVIIVLILFLLVLVLELFSIKRTQDRIFKSILGLENRIKKIESGIVKNESGRISGFENWIVTERGKEEEKPEKHSERKPEEKAMETIQGNFYHLSEEVRTGDASTDKPERKREYAETGYNQGGYSNSQKETPNKRDILCGLEVDSSIAYNPSGIVKLIEKNSEDAVYHMDSEGNVFPKESCFKTYNQRAFFKRHYFENLYNIYDKNRKSVNLEKTAKLLSVEQAAKVRKAGQKYELQQKGILIAEMK